MSEPIVATSAGPGVYLVTERQLTYIESLLKLTETSVPTLLHEINRVRRANWQCVDGLEALRREQASWAIDVLQGIRDHKRPPLDWPGGTSGGR